MEQSSLQGVNQQVSLEAKMGWLGGIIDGEGHIGLGRYQDNKYVFQPRFEIVNTNKLIIDTYQKFFDEFQFPYHVRYIPETQRNKAQWRICTQGFKRLYKILPIIIPYLIGKKQVALWLLELIESRLKLNSNSVAPSKRKWSEDELKLADKINNFNKRRFSKTPETIRQTLPKCNEDIVRTE